MNFNYLKYLFRKEGNTNTVLLIIMLISYPFINLSLRPERFSYGLNMTDRLMSSFSAADYVSIITFMIVLFILSFVMVAVNFRYLHFRRSVDTYMQLPMTKTEIFATRLVYTILQVVVMGLLVFWLGTALMVFRGAVIRPELLVWISLTMLAGLILLIFFNVFVYQKCNSMVDGIIIMLMYHGLLLLIDVMLIFVVFDYNQAFPIDFNLFSVDYTYFAMIFHRFPADVSIMSFLTVKHLRPLLIFIIIGLGSLFLSFREVKKRDAERAEQVTDDKACYPLVITGFAAVLFMLTIIIDDGIQSLLIGALVIFIPYLVGIFIYKRKVVIKARYIITYLIVLTLSSAFVFSAQATDSFGLERQFPQNYAYATATITYYPYNSNQLSEDREYLLSAINSDIRTDYSPEEYDSNHFEELTVFADPDYSNIRVFSSDDIGEFEKLMLNLSELNENNTGVNASNVYLSLEYYNRYGELTDHRYGNISMDLEELVDFVNSID